MRMAVRERMEPDERERLVVTILERYPPIDRLEEVMGPEPGDEGSEEVEAFLAARSRWQLPYSSPAESE
jgi:hypothetical protein